MTDHPTARTETPTEEKAMTTQGPTPRTDALVATHADEHNEHGRPVGYQYCDLADFARTLERELQQALRERDELRAEVRQLGYMGDVCTYDTLKEICENCRCKRRAEGREP